MTDTIKLRLTIGAIVIAALGIGSMWLLVPPLADSDTQTFYSPFGVPTTLVDLTLAIGGGILFLRALRKFKNELKPAWRLFALAQITLGLLTLVFPVVEYYYLWENFWWNLSTYFPYLVGSILMFFGARRFYRIFRLHGWSSNLKIIIPIIIVAWGAHALIPHINTWEHSMLNEFQYNMVELVVIIPVVLYIAAAYMIFKIRLLVGSEYKKAFGWLTLGLGLLAFSTITILILDTYGYENWYFLSRTYIIPTIMGDIGILTAAYYFNAIGSPRQQFSLGQRLRGDNIKHHPITSADIIVYIAGMASTVDKIDEYLDNLRIVTARQEPEQPVSESDQRIFLSVYLNIEKYLVTNEPLRVFTVEGIRNDVVSHFNLNHSNASQTFWPKITL